MGIEKIKTSSMEGVGQYNRAQGNKAHSTNRAYLSAPHDYTTFTGNAAAPVAKAGQSLRDFLLDLMPSKIKMMVKMHEGMGEVQNQIINAVGTGLVAPVFIKYNPLSKTDEDTRTYTAWRQPVSAILAVGTQAAIVVPFNSLIKKMADIGFFPIHNNSSLFPSDDYLKKQIKEQNPDKSYTKAEMKNAIKAKQKEYAKALEKMILDTNKITVNTTNGIDGKIVKEDMKPEDFKKLFKETLDGLIKDETEEMHKATTQKGPKKLARNLFYHEHLDETLKVLDRLRGKAGVDTAVEDAATSSDKEIAKAFKKECNDTIKDIKKAGYDSKTKSTLIEIVKELKDINHGITNSAERASFINKIDKMMTSAKQMAAMNSVADISDYVNNIIKLRISAIDGSTAILKDIREKLETSSMTVKEAQDIINAEIAKAKGNKDGIMESAGQRLRDTVGSLADKIGEQFKKNNKANIEGTKRWLGLASSLAILPVTCWMLNKIYPWFMDLAFPNLSNKKAAPKDAEKKVEVK